MIDISKFKIRLISFLIIQIVFLNVISAHPIHTNQGLDDKLKNLTVFHEEKDFGYLNNKKVAIKALEDGIKFDSNKVYLPFGVIAVTFGFHTAWLSDTHLKLIAPANEIDINFNQNKIYYNKELLKSNVTFIKSESTYYLPLDVFCELLGKKIDVIDGFIIISDESYSSTIKNDTELLNELENYFLKPHYFEKKMISKSPFHFDMTVNDLDTPEENVVYISTEKDGKPYSLGTGFAIGDGLYVTTFNTVKYADKIKVISKDNISYPVEGIVKFNENKNLAIIKTTSIQKIKPFHLAKMDENNGDINVFTIKNINDFKKIPTDKVISISRNNSGKVYSSIVSAKRYYRYRTSLFTLSNSVFNIGNGFADGHNLDLVFSLNDIQDWIYDLSKIPFSQINTIDIKNQMKPELIEANSRTVDIINKAFAALNDMDSILYNSLLEADHSEHVYSSRFTNPIYNGGKYKYEVEEINVVNNYNNEITAEVIYTTAKPRDNSFKDFRSKGFFTIRKTYNRFKIVRAKENFLHYVEELNSPNTLDTGNTKYHIKKPLNKSLTRQTQSISGDTISNNYSKYNSLYRINSDIELDLYFDKMDFKSPRVRNVTGIGSIEIDNKKYAIKGKGDFKTIVHPNTRQVYYIGSLKDVDGSSTCSVAFNFTTGKAYISTNINSKDYPQTLVFGDLDEINELYKLIQ